MILVQLWTVTAVLVKFAVPSYRILSSINHKQILPLSGGSWGGEEGVNCLRFRVQNYSGIFFVHVRIFPYGNLSLIFI